MLFGLPQIPGRASAQQKQEASIDDILPSTHQRIVLIVLIAVCTDHMRSILIAALENQTVTASKQVESKESGKHGNEGLETQNRSDLLWPRSTISQMESMKASGVSFFNDWRTSVLRRTGEALNVRSDAVKAAKAHYQASNSANQHASRTDQANTQKNQFKPKLPFPVVALPDALQQLDEKARALVLGAVLFMLLSLETYPAQSRVLMSYLCRSLDLPYDVLCSEEATAATTLLNAASKAGSGIDAEDVRKKKEEEGTFGRKWKVGLATVAGAAVIGITGGLAAPVILGLAGTIMGGVGLGGLATLLGATIVNPVTIGALFGALGGRMTGRAMDAYSKEVEDFKFLPVDEIKPLSVPSEAPALAPAHKLRVAIGISGWVTKESDVSRPWRVFSSSSVEPFALRYEQAALISLSTTLENVIKSNAFGMIRGQGLQLLLPQLAAAMAPVGLLSAGQFIDNPFTIALERSDKAGKVLAQALIDRSQGERPVTLVGFSMGARVIYSCLEELAAKNAFGLVENAVLVGSPVPNAEMSWRRMRAVVAGRLINVYTRRDVVLGYLYRARNLTLNIAGLEPVSVRNVENKDVSEFVDGHNQYILAIGRILQELSFADLDLDQVAQENLELDHEKDYEEEVYKQAKKEGRLAEFEDENGQIKLAGASQPGSAERVADEEKNSGGELLLTEELANTRIDNGSSHNPSSTPEAHHTRQRDTNAESEINADSEAESDHEPLQMTDVEHEPIPDSPLFKQYPDNDRH